MSDVTIDKQAGGGSWPREIAPAIRVRLRALRLRITLWFLVDGLSRVLLLLIALALFDLWLDWTFRMDLAQRVIMLILILGGLCAMLVWRLIRPLIVSPGDDALVLQVERRNKQLGESLISSVQFSRMSEAELPGVSQSMIRATIEHGTRAAQQVSFAGTLNARWFLINVALLVFSVAVVALGGVAVANTETMSIWFNRNVLLRNDVSWPQSTYLRIEGDDDNDGRIIMLRGEDHRQLVTVEDRSEQIPDKVYLDFRPARTRTSQRMQKAGDDEERQFQYVFKNVIEEFEFRARGGDAITPWMKVELVDQPEVTQLDLIVTPPTYTGRQTDALPPGKGPYYLLPGSELRLEGETNKPLSEANLQVGGKTWPLSIADDRRISLTIPPAELISGKYEIQLTDTGGLAAKRPTSFGIRIAPDKSPRVRAKLLGISGIVVPQARVPFECRVTDEFAVTSVFLSYQWHGEDEAAGEQGDVQFEEAAALLGGKAVEFIDIWDLEPIDLPTGSALTFRFKALDNDDQTKDKPPGESPEFLLRVVTEEHLRTDLLRREKEQRQEFERLLKNQEDLLTDTQALKANVTGMDDFDAEQKQELMRIQRRQKLIATNTGSIAKQMEDLLDEIYNNRLEEEGGPLESRLVNRIIVPMMELSVTDVPEAVQHIDRSRRLAEDATQRDAALGDAVAQQEAIVQTMREILIHMVKTEGYQEAINLLYEIEKAQKEVQQRTEEEKQKRIQEILEKGGQVTPADEDGSDGDAPPDSE